METLFSLSPEELKEVSVEAEFDEEQKLILNEENCIHQDGIIIFKQPIHVKRGRILGGIASRIIIVKREENDSNQMYVFVMTESSSDEDRELIHEFFEIENCRDKGCITLRTRSANWIPGGCWMEV